MTIEAQKGGRCTAVPMGDQHHAPAALPPGKKPVTPCRRGWVRHRAGLDGCRVD